ncbi:hypothetical protein MKW92_037585 [Papaver armeniacum]|nr:hypothetical protein MKW92_037585 [Papaver armeniacum]
MVSSFLLISSEEGGGNIPTDTNTESSSQQKQTDEGYASSISTDYSEEASSESDYSESGYSESDYSESDDVESDAEFDEGWDGKIDGVYVGPYACLNNYKPQIEHKKICFAGVGGWDAEQFPLKQAGDIWRQSWPEEGETTEFDCGGYAVILRNKSAHPIAARANFSLDGKSYLFQVLSGLLAGLRVSSNHGIPLICKCEGSKIGKICHTCANSIVPYMSDDCFETLVPLIEKFQDKYKYLGSSNFACVSRKKNEAAHYLAKEAKKDALSNKKLLVDYEKGKLVDYEADMKPNEFPEKLVSFLLNDAYDSIYYNSDARGKLEESVNPCD